MNVIRVVHGFDSVQNFTLSSVPTLCTTSWQPLEIQDNLFAFTAGRVSGSALCTAPCSNERAPNGNGDIHDCCTVRAA